MYIKLMIDIYIYRERKREKERKSERKKEREGKRNNLKR